MILGLNKFYGYVWGVVVAGVMGAGLVGTQIHSVTITVKKPHQNRNITLWTFGKTVRTVLTQAHILVSSHDHVSPALGSLLKGKNITVKRAIPIQVNTAQEHIRYWTTQYTVGGVLSALSIKLGPNDRVTPSLRTVLSARDMISVTQQWAILQQHVAAVPYPVKHQSDPHLLKGHSKILQKGKDGQKEITTSESLQNGVVTAVKTISKKLLKAPTPQIVAEGTASPPPPQPAQVSRPVQLVNRGAGSVDASAVAGTALRYRHVGYRMGGTSPRTGFDCSGFTRWVFGRLGIDLPRTSYAQWSAGTHVSRSDMSPGDLVFFTTDGVFANHVGIYLGSDQFISALNPAEGVAIRSMGSSYWSRSYDGAIRVR